MSISTDTRVQCSIAYLATSLNGTRYRRRPRTPCRSRAGRPCRCAARPARADPARRRGRPACSGSPRPLVDLLEHEAHVEPALLCARDVPRHLEGLDLDLVAVQIRDANVPGPHLDHLVLVDRQDGPRLLEHRGSRTRGRSPRRRARDDQRRRDPDTDDDVGFVEREDDERVRPVELAGRGSHAIRRADPASPRSDGRGPRCRYRSPGRGRASGVRYAGR